MLQLQQPATLSFQVLPAKRAPQTPSLKRLWPQHLFSNRPELGRKSRQGLGLKVGEVRPHCFGISITMQEGMEAALPCQTEDCTKDMAVAPLTLRTEQLVAAAKCRERPGNITTTSLRSTSWPQKGVMITSRCCRTSACGSPPDSSLCPALKLRTHAWMRRYDVIPRAAA